jgi:V/A-type H+-transporting ATPase subunit D
MTDKILMNKNTLAALKVELREYREALPIFEMKEQQLVGVVRRIEADVERLRADIARTERSVQDWIGVLAEPGVFRTEWVQIEQVHTTSRDIVGVAVEEFADITFAPVDVDPYTTPLWVDAAIAAVRDQLTNQTIIAIQQKALALLEEELTEARRMKNALKEVFIPETKDKIRRIEIYLGDVERLSIGCAKLVKKKKERKAASL